MFGGNYFGAPYFGQGPMVPQEPPIPPEPVHFEQPIFMRSVHGEQGTVNARGRQGTGTVRGRMGKLSDVSGE